jgi:peptide/nickel transport system substrate-binding protein
MSFQANKDLPMMSPFIMTVDPATTNQVTFARNPYYWAVDEAGNQLPYLDGCVITLVESTDIAIMKAIAGEVDVQIATLAENFANYPLLAEHMDEQGYTLGTYDPNEPNAMNIVVNPAGKDEDKRAVMSQKDFRTALSQGINREEIVASMWTVGPYAAKIAQSSPIEASPYYSEEMATQFTAFDAAAANALLDKLGMTSYDAAGYRLSPTGKESIDSIEVWQDIALTYARTATGFTATVALPLAKLGLTPAPGTAIKLDVGYIFGNETGNATSVRAYWSNHSFSAGVTADIPNEIRIEPNQWGNATVE